MIEIIKENKIIVVTLILIALLGAVSFGNGFYSIFLSTVSAQGPGGGQEIGRASCRERVCVGV